MKFILRITSLLIVVLFAFLSCTSKVRNVDTEEFKKSSKVVITSYENETVENLVVLGKVWGFLKYHHPSIAAGNYNWDFELFRILPSVLEADSEQKRNAVLEEWIAKIGKFKTAKTDPVMDENRIKIRPDILWIENEEALGSVSKRLIEIKNAQRTGEHYALKMCDYVDKPIFEEKAYTYLRYPDVGYRLLALYRYWNIIEYYFPYKYLIDESWDGVLAEFVPQFINAKNATEYQLCVRKLAARIQDTHADVFRDIVSANKLAGVNGLPLEVKFVEGKAIVTKKLRMVNSTDCALKVGDVILKIDGQPVDSIVEHKKPYIAASNHSALLREIAPLLMRTNNTGMQIEYERDGALSFRTVKCHSIGDIHYENKSQMYKPLVEMIDDDITYLYLGSTKGGTVPENIQTKGLIIDLRCYPTIEKVEGYWEYNELFPMPTPFVKCSKFDIYQPGLFTFSDPISTGIENANYYKGKVIILVNEISQSHSEYTAMKYKCSPNATIIGSTTAGADGNITKFVLPGGITAVITGLGVYYPDGGETQRIGIVPDLEVLPTIKGIREGRDEVLEQAIAMIHS